MPIAHAATCSMPLENPSKGEVDNIEVRGVAQIDCS